MAVFTWSWYNGSSWVPFGTNLVDKIGFFGWNTDVATSFGVKIYVGSFNDTMHLRKISDGTDDCVSPHMTGIKYIASGTCSINHGVTANLSTVTQNQSIQINFADAGMSNTENSYFYCHGAAVTDAPSGVVTYAAEQANVSWTPVAGSGTKLTLSNPSGASVNWYVIITASPQSIGAKDTNFTWRIETDYY